VLLSADCPIHPARPVTCVYLLHFELRLITHYCHLYAQLKCNAGFVTCCEVKYTAVSGDGIRGCALPLATVPPTGAGM
jgi:hypothetical protein